MMRKMVEAIEIKLKGKHKKKEKKRLLDTRNRIEGMLHKYEQLNMADDETSSTAESVDNDEPNEKSSLVADNNRV